MFFILELILILAVSTILSLEDYLTGFVNVILIFAGVTVILFLRIFNFTFKDTLIFFFQGGFYTLFYLIVYFTSGKKLGFGDLLFSFFCGFCILRWDFLWLSMALTYINFLFFYSICKLKKINLRNKRIPFIPFMSAGLIVTYILSYSL